MSNKEELLSINDYLEESNLPSYKDFIEEKEELPSVEDYKTHPLEEDQTIEDANGNTFAEVIDVVKAPEWQELVKLVNDVRREIPEIPEIKSYDEEIGQISEKIAQIQENFSIYDLKSDKIFDLKSKNEEFEVKLTEIEQKIPEVPEVRYYEGDIELIYSKISRIKEEIDSLPEVKYYENDLDTLKSRIEEVNENIPTFPKWVNEINEVQDFSWIGKTFGVIDDDFKKVQGHLDLIRDTIESRVSELNETIETKDFEQRVDSKTLSENLESTNTKLSETKDKIYKELREMTLRVYDHHKEFKDDDRKLKKAILGEQNKLKQALNEQIKSIEKESIKTDEKIISFYVNLREEVEQKLNSLPEVKYYDNDIKKLQVDVKNVKTNIKGLITELYKIATVIKKQQKNLTEGLLNEPPNEKETAGGQTDPLTPMDQKFATLEDLSNHYRLFINRIQTQLSTMGGGGAGFIKDLDDVTFDQTTGTNELLIYDGAKWVGIASTALSSSSSETQGLNNVLSIGNTSSTGMSVGVVTATQFFGDGSGLTGVANTNFIVGTSITMTTGNFTGNVTVGGTITYEDVTNVDSIGIITGRDNINIVTDGKKLQIGAGSDLQLYHDSNQSFIDNNTGPLFIRNNVDDDDGGNIIIQAKSGKSSAVFQDDEGVRLYYNDVEKFETLSGGVNVTGNIETDTLNVTGVGTITDNLSIKSQDSSPGRIDLYCESSNAHYARIQAPAHSAFSGNITLTLPSDSGTLLTNVVEDTTPQLGGNLDINGKYITGTGGAAIVGVVTATTFNGNLATTNLTGTITNSQLDGSIANDKLANSSVSYGGVSLALGASDATPAFDLSDATNYPTSSLSGTITNAQLAGSIADGKLASTFLKNVVEDTTPELGGNLGLNSKDITGTGDINITGTVTSDGVFLGDDEKIHLGDGGDLKIWHNGFNSIINDEGSGDLYLGGDTGVFITNAALSEFKGKFITNGAVELYYDNVLRLTTTNSGVSITDNLNVAGVSTFQGHIHIGDDDELRFGANNDFKIVHDPNDCRFENSNGDIKFKNTGSYFFFDENGGETLASFINDGAINLFYDGGKKFETTPTGVNITDDLNVAGVSTFAGNINANGNIVGDNATSILGINSVTAITYFGDGSQLTGSGGGTLIQGISIEEEGVNVGTAGSIKTINFKGAKVTAASVNATKVDVTVNTGLNTEGTSGFVNLFVAGVSTFTGDINANGNIVGDSATNISGINSVTAGTYFGNGVNLSGIVTSLVAGANISISGATGQVTIAGLANTANVTANTLTVSGFSTFASASFSGNVTIGGTLTYEDVTNIDSVGIITARAGIRIGTGGTVGPVGSGIVTYFGDGSQLSGVQGGKWEETDVGINTSSNVGIGTTNPIHKLEVVGDTNLTGNLNVIGITTINGNSVPSIGMVIALSGF